jgi:hypothetical protein
LTDPPPFQNPLVLPLKPNAESGPKGINLSIAMF